MAIKEVHSAETLHVSWQKESQNALQAPSEEREHYITITSSPQLPLQISRPLT